MFSFLRLLSYSVGKVLLVTHSCSLSSQLYAARPSPAHNSALNLPLPLKYPAAPAGYLFPYGSPDNSINFLMLQSANPFTTNSHQLTCQPGGDEGTRTPDIRLAKAALSHLSYIPVFENDDRHQR